jgi:hypothetical protein
MRRMAIGMALVMAMAIGLGSMTLGLAGTARAEPCCGPITPAGERLARFLDGTGVDHLWLAGHHVDWRTGEATPGTREAATHCSAFVAAAAERLGVYVLRSPDHSQELLANAQLRWLHGAPDGSGWRSLPDPAAAQATANRGELALEAFENPNPHRPGHIAIVRPSEQSRAALDRDGPRETQAGETNALDTVTAVGFRHHRGAWVPDGGGGIRYYAHAIDWAKLP